MSKIGTITFHCAYNYGAVLQAYSLVKFLKNQNYQAEVIDYWPPRRIEDKNRFFLNKNIFHPVIIIQNMIKFLKMTDLKDKKNKYDIFRSEILSVSSTICNSSEDLKKISKHYNYIITGSDQVWNPMTGYDGNYFLEFAEHKQKIAYAPSIGVPNIPSNLAPKIANLINDFSYLSSREHRGSEIIKELTGRDSLTVVDPVFLQTKEEWLDITVPMELPEKYILVYVVRRRKNMETYLNKLKAELDLPIYLIVGTNSASRGFISADKVFWSAGPKEFVTLFSKATVVCTNSFHGTAFSLIFRKPFLVFPHTTGDSRVKSILSRCDLEERIVSPETNNFKDPFALPTGNFDLLEQEIKASKEYLLKAVS